MNKIVIILFLLISNIAGATITKTIGATGDYTSITAAWAAIPGIESPITQPWILEIKSDYNIASETLPIDLTAISGASATNTITIRPQTGVTALSLTTGAATSIFQFNAADYVIIDGRPGGIGTSELTIENTQTAGGKFAINLLSTATFCTIKYCTIKSSNAVNSTTGGSEGGVIFLTGTTSNCTIDNNTIRESSGGNPYVSILAYVGAGSITTNTVSNNNIINFSQRGITLSTGTTAWTITGNSFYQTGSITPTGTTFSMIRLAVGTDFTITGNYFGGQAASCGGSPYTLATSTSQLFIIQVAGGSGGTNTIASNTIQNMATTSTYSHLSAAVQMALIYISAGSNIITIGSSGNANTFGATTGTGSISHTDNNTGAGTCFAAIFNQGTGATTIAYNNFGAITVAGTNASGRVSIIRHNGTAGTCTADNNTIGHSATANNIIISSAMELDVITDIGGSGAYTFTISNNTIQQINHTTTATNAGFIIHCAIGTGSITSNTIKNITSTTNATFILIGHCGSGYSTEITTNTTINSNTIQDITLTNAASTGQFMAIIANTSGSVTANSNTIGSTTSNNIVIANNATVYGIYILESSSFSSSSTLIRNFNITGTSTGNTFKGFSIDGAGAATLTSCKVNNCTTVTTGVNAFYGIQISTTGTSNSLTSCQVSTIATSTGTTYGIIISSTAGSGTISKSKIINITSSAATAATVAGIYSSHTTTWNLYNCIVQLPNTDITNGKNLYGMYFNGSTGTLNAYHNTIKISGNQTTSSTFTFAFYDNSDNTTTRSVKNNIFQNTRTGTSTLGHFAVSVNNTTGATYDYNYEEVSDDANKLGEWGGTDYNFTDWKTNSGAANDKNGTITINNLGAVPAATTSDVQTTGTNDHNASVSTDYDANVRSNVGDGSPNGPWIGAFETVTALPIELLTFTGAKSGRNNELKWSTATELNNDFFTIEKTIDGIDFDIIGYVNGAGNSTQISHYSVIDSDVKNVINYYRLKQTDNDGLFDYSNIISVDNRVNSENKEIVYITNLLGQEVNEYYRGVVIMVYKDGTSKKVIQ